MSIWNGILDFLRYSLVTEQTSWHKSILNGVLDFIFDILWLVDSLSGMSPHCMGFEILLRYSLVSGLT